MEFHLLPIFAFLYLAVAVSHASIPPEVYWQTALPNTPMPKAIKDLLPQPAGKSTSVDFSNEELHSQKHDYGVTYSKGMPPVRKHSYGFTYSEERPGPIRKHTYYGFTYSEESRKSRPIHKQGYDFKYSAEETSAEQNVDSYAYFLEENLQPGTKMKLQFTNTREEDAFLPREVAELIPFSSKKLPEILKRFPTVKPKSPGARVMKETLEVCEGSANPGEKKYCATSLESLIDFSISEVGKNVKVFSTDVEAGTKDYKIGEVKMVGNDAVACHNLEYPYAVFYCHATHSTRTYLATLKDSDGKKSEAVAICHVDTSTWNPKNLAFQILKVKPGTVPVCHFVPNGHIIWVSSK